MGEPPNFSIPLKNTIIPSKDITHLRTNTVYPEDTMSNKIIVKIKYPCVEFDEDECQKILEESNSTLRVLEEDVKYSVMKKKIASIRNKTKGKK